MHNQAEICILLNRLKEAFNSTLLNNEAIIVNDGKEYAVKKGIMHTHGDVDGDLEISADAIKKR